MILPHTSMEVPSPENTACEPSALRTVEDVNRGVICVPWHLLAQTHPSELVSRSRYCQFLNRQQDVNVCSVALTLIRFQVIHLHHTNMHFTWKSKLCKGLLSRSSKGSIPGALQRVGGMKAQFPYSSCLGGLSTNPVLTWKRNSPKGHRAGVGWGLPWLL